jgi:hypothetical protein
MNKKIFLILALVLFLISTVFGNNFNFPSGSIVSDTSYKSFRLFEDENLLEISLRFDIATYFRTKPEKDYLKADITFHLSKTDSLNKQIKLRTRGNFRNKNCSFPPIELNFKKRDFGYSDLNRISKLKLVTECASNTENKNYVLREYLIYKMFNILSDTSFRVRLLSIHYLDSKEKRKPITQFGFFIEPVEMVSTRANSIRIESENLTQRSIQPAIMDRLALFNYMIGNYDWSIAGQHNIRIIRPQADSLKLGIAFPYDFDWSGLVDAAYAVPAETAAVKSVRERIFLGMCRTRDTYQKDLELFLNKKEEFYRLINEFPFIDQKGKRDITGYLDEFFDEITRKDFIDTLLNTCKKF